LRISSLVFLRVPCTPSSPLFPYTTLFRSVDRRLQNSRTQRSIRLTVPRMHPRVGSQTGNSKSHRWRDRAGASIRRLRGTHCRNRSEEHTSELQSRFDLVCRLLLEKKKTTK